MAGPRADRKSTDQIKVAHVTTVDLSLRFLMLNQLESLRDAGYSITGISSAGPHIAALQDRGIPHIPVSMRRSITPVSDLMALWRLYWILRRERFTIVHCHTPKAELLGQLAARLAGVPIVVDTFRGIPHDGATGRIRRSVLLAMSRLAAACADLVLCQSRESMDLMMRARLCPPERLALLGNGIDIARFDRTQLNARDLDVARKELGIERSQPVVGFVGRLVREKGLVDLFRAMRLVREKLPTARLLVVGPVDPDKPDAVRLDEARRHGVAQGCIFTGLRTDMPTLYGLMDVFVLPTYRESFPRSPMEASAMGVPCVVTDIPGCREVVEDGRNGLLVPAGNALALADAISSVLTRPDLARQMGQEGRRRAIERFDENRTFEIVRAAYQSLLARKGITHVSRPVEAVL